MEKKKKKKKKKYYTPRLAVFGGRLFVSLVGLFILYLIDRFEGFIFLSF